MVSIWFTLVKGKEWAELWKPQSQLWSEFGMFPKQLHKTGEAFSGFSCCGTFHISSWLASAWLTLCLLLNTALHTALLLGEKGSSHHRLKQLRRLPNLNCKTRHSYEATHICWHQPTPATACSSVCCSASHRELCKGWSNRLKTDFYPSAATLALTKQLAW